MKKLSRNIGYIVISAVLLIVAVMVFTSPFIKDNPDIKVDPKTEYIKEKEKQAKKTYEEAKQDSTIVRSIDSALWILSGRH